jgi:type IV secretion system protein VirD4
MSFKDWFRSDAERLGRAVPSLLMPEPAASTVAVSHDPKHAQDVLNRLPRGADVIRDQIDRKERARWARPNEIAAFRYQPGHAVLGKHNGHLIGIGDDKPMVTIASARSGKTSTVLKPTLYTYPGSMVVLDPKGELATATARHRREVLGQRVDVIDPFQCSNQPAASFNPLAEFEPQALSILDDVDLLCETIILDEGGADGSHWTNSARALLRGLMLHVLQLPESERNLTTVRQLLTLTHSSLLAAQRQLEANGSKDPAEAAQNALFMEMAAQGNAFGGALAGAGNSFLRKAPRERSSIVSTAETQTRFLDSLPLQAALRSSDVSLADLADRPTTLYICLPSSHMTTHFRWLRIVVRLALMALEKRGTWPIGKPHILFMMEEFATLGHLPIMEQAAAYFPGFGVKLWAVLQDLGQLRRHYKASHQTFLGNAGVLQFFSNSDKETLDFISDRLGSLSFVRGKFGATEDDKARDYVDKERLLYPHETAEAFARATGSQLLIVEGQPPMAIERLTFEDVEQVRMATAMQPVPSRR